MNEFCENYKKTHKVLTLQMTREYFVEVLHGRQKVEHRFVYPNNTSVYVDIIPFGDGDYDKVVPKKYDALYFINGRRKDAPRMLVEVLGVEFFLCVDEEGKYITFKENGIEYYQSKVHYQLGNVLNTENCGDL